MKKHFPKVIATLLAILAIATFYLSSSIIFDLFGVRAQQGNFVLFVVWVNLISSLIYFVSVYGFFATKKWTAKLLTIPMIFLVLAFIGLSIHANSGGLHETKTFYAIIFRFVVTLISFATAYFFISKNKSE